MELRKSTKANFVMNQINSIIHEKKLYFSDWVHLSPTGLDSRFLEILNLQMSLLKLVVDKKRSGSEDKN